MHPVKYGRPPLTILAVIASGFIFIAGIVWLDELLDLPHRLFGAPASPFRPHEAAFESSLVIVFGIVLMLLISRLFRRVAYVESLIVLCAWCHRVRLDSSWVSIETFLRVHRAESSHGICPECASRMEAELPPLQLGTT